MNTLESRLIGRLRRSERRGSVGSNPTSPIIRATVALSNLEKARRGRAKRQALLNDIKSAGCKECGFKADLKALHFHHRNPSEKFLKLSDMTTYSFARIRAEVAKCDVLCEDCHKTVHRVDKLY